MKKTLQILCLPTPGPMDEIIEKIDMPIKITKSAFARISIIFDGKKTQILHDNTPIVDFSFVWLNASWNNKDIAYATNLYLQAHKIPSTEVEQTLSKITDHMIFALNNIPVPQTLFFKRSTIAKKLDLIKKVCGYPLIIKDTKGYGGALSELVRSQTELLEKIKELPKHREFLFQKFIPNDYDWGVLVENGTVVSGEKSYPAQGEFLNNACNGAKEVFIETHKIPQKVKDIAIAASESLDLTWSRADIVIDKNTGDAFLMEVNRCPGITSDSSEVTSATAFLTSQLLWAQHTYSQPSFAHHHIHMKV